MGDQSKAKFVLGHVPDPFSGSFSRPPSAEQPGAAAESEAQSDAQDWLVRPVPPDPLSVKTPRFTNKHPDEYPGAGLPVRHEFKDRKYPIGVHYNCSGPSSDLLTINEVAMMALMDKLTDKPNWHQKVYDEAIVAKWREEALRSTDDGLYWQAAADKIRDAKSQENQQHEGGEEDEESDEDEHYLKDRILPRPGTCVLSEVCFDYCIEELRSKAEFFNKQGLVHTLDTTTTTIIKSDTIVSPELHDALRAAFAKLVADQAGDVDWHPRSNDMVRDIIHPSMYPLVYGFSKFIKEEAVGVEDAIDNWASLGETVLKKKTYRGGDISGVPGSFWSDTYQWLPANVAFQEDGTVRFTSYINNLHPKKYPDIYRTLEKLIDIVIPAWDHCLVPERDRFPRTTRILVPGDDYYDDDDPFHWESMSDVFERCGQSLENISLKDLQRFSESELSWNPLFDKPEDELQENPEVQELVQKFKEEHREHIESWLWKKDRLPLLPEPDEFLKDENDFNSSEELKERFAETGLQVIVKMATIELTPEKPEFPRGGWHVEGIMNEHICATALYYLDSENVTTSHLAFRTQTDEDQDISNLAAQDSYNWLERTYGTALGGNGGTEEACLQYYGTVETRQGRLLAFPNTFHHRVSSFRLQDLTKPGHRRFVALWLVDPHQRIVSTANVPPQQLDWWTEAAFAGAGAGNGDSVPPELLHLLAEKPGLARLFRGRQVGEIRLPNELLDMVRQHGVVPEGLMDVEEARNHRLRLMEERSQFHADAKDEWLGLNYSFCEH